MPDILVDVNRQNSIVLSAGANAHVSMDVVDTTAAGDAFIGGFAYSLLQNRSPEEASVMDAPPARWRQPNSALNLHCQ